MERVFQRNKLTRILATIATLFLTAMFIASFPSTHAPQELTAELSSQMEPPSISGRKTATVFQLTKPHRYITNGHRFFGGRLGNQLFRLAAMLYLADVTGRRLVLTRYVDEDAENYYFDRWFDVDQSVAVITDVGEKINLTSSLGSFSDVLYSGRDLSFDDKWVESIRNRSVPDGDLSAVTTLRLCAGYFMSWRYVEPISSRLRRLFRPKPEVVNRVRQYFESVRPKNWTNYLRVGVHVRAGDMREKIHQQVGFTVPTRVYFERALRQIIQNAEKIRCKQTVPCHHRQQMQIVVATDEFRWTNENINFTAILLDLAVDHALWSSNGTKHKQLNFDLDIVYSRGHDTGFDLVALSMCDVLVMSTGSYGWWASWLSRKTVYYFNSWPRAGSNHLNSVFTRYDYFPPTWRGINAPHFEFSYS